VAVLVRTKTMAASKVVLDFEDAGQRVELVQRRDLQ
jgi:hypothetical protein